MRPTIDAGIKSLYLSRMQQDDLEIFLVTVPGLEGALFSEAKENGFKNPELEKGGVTIRGSWQEVWRANLVMRGASHVLVRLGNFRAVHLAKLDKHARKFPWADTLRPDVPVRVEVTCRKSRIYHHKAAAERFENAIKEEFGATIDKDSDVCIKVRILDDKCTVSVDTSGEPLHKRGHKEAVNKAPMRENIAALLLKECGYKGTEPIMDPMCGSGTFVIEAAEIAAGLLPGRTRSFAFEKLATFNTEKWQKLKTVSEPKTPSTQFFGFDRDAGAVKMSTANAERAGVESFTNFDKNSISNIAVPDGLAGLVIINPPYGVRIGEIKKLTSLYQSIGRTLRANFAGWRVGIATNSDQLAKATGLRFTKKTTSFSHGGIHVKLYKTTPLPKNL
ncbi:MAG: class I SAM-dependent RNA methyltransferase [Kordiimonas sp.]